MTKHPLIYLPVSVEKELPKKDGRYFVKVDNEFEDGGLFLQGGFWGDQEIGKTTEWLKPTPNAYVFTEDELLDLKKKWASEAWENGFARGDDQQNVITPDGQIFPDKETYLNNLNIE